MRVFKTFMLWLLIAALPIQGLAAVVKVSCGPKHHHDSAVAVSESGHHHVNTSFESASDLHRHMHSHAHVHEALMSGALMSDLSDGSASGDKQIPKSSTCSACATCCFGGVAPPSSASSASAFDTFQPVAIPAAHPFTGFFPAGLERPPRHLSI